MSTSSDVLELLDRWASAEQAGDAAALESVLAADFAGVGPAGFVLTRDQWLVRFANGLHNDAFAVQEPQVREFGDAAAVIAVLEQQTHFGGQDNSGRFRLSLLVVRDADQWRLAGVHIGLLQLPPGAGLGPGTGN
ncbi:nuclear transport factor 2 family protein [Microlunatus speluncae]|uniref:nuclear transport factor 2 family protein n=1 Tax=Microlunatus speluncae TaxID=2594267 RepID=UPI00126623E1|nr:nuclear transport factor 2 family protein [Microlunatus speluncae]